MRFYKKLNTDTEVLHHQKVEIGKNERINRPKEVRCLCKGFGFTTWFIADTLTGGLTKK
jgi:hypothetical protein